MRFVSPNRTNLFFAYYYIKVLDFYRANHLEQQLNKTGVVFAVLKDVLSVDSTHHHVVNTCSTDIQTTKGKKKNLTGGLQVAFQLSR